MLLPWFIWYVNNLENLHVYTHTYLSLYVAKHLYLWLKITWTDIIIIFISGLVDSVDVVAYMYNN